MTIKAKIFENGDMQVNEEFIEIPQELVGGRNLVKKSNVFKTGGGASGITASITTEGYLKFVTTSGNGNWHTGWYDNLNDIESQFQEGETFTISFTIKSDNSTYIPTIYIKSGMGYYSMSGKVGTEFSTISYTGQWKKTNTMIPHIGWNGVAGTFYIKDWKIEKNNKATTWTPAPEDLGLNIPMSIQNFDNPIQFNDNSISSKELVEISDILTSNRNLFNVTKYVELEKDSYGKNTYSLTPNGKLQINLIDSRGTSFSSYKNIYSIEEKTTYTFSANASMNWRIYTYDESGNLISNFTGTGNSRTFTTIVGTRQLSVKFFPVDSNYPVIVSDIKLEKGEKITPWTPSYEELGWNIPLNVNDLRGGRNLVLNSRSNFYTPTTEFMTTLDLEPVFEKYGLIEYTISFDIKSLKPNATGSMQVYTQNGNGMKSIFMSNVTGLTTEFQRKSVTVTPVRSTFTNETKSMLAFYGVYNTGNIPVVRDVKIEIGKSNDITWKPALEDLGINLPKWITKIDNNPLSINPQGLSMSGDFSEYPNITKDGLILWYDFKGRGNTDNNKNKAIDLSERKNHGMLQNFSFDSTNGYREGRLQFDGVDDLITVKDNIDFNPQDELCFDITFSLKNLGKVQRLMGKIWTSYSLAVWTGNNINLNVGRNIMSNTVLKANQVYHIVGQISVSKNRAEIWINGNLDYSDVAGITGIPVYGSDLYIGRYTSTQQYFDGDMYSVRFYNRLLSQEEIVHNYELEKGRW